MSLPRSAEASVRAAELRDVPTMAALAELKRHQYRDHAAPFQRPAGDGREAHEAFLPKLLEWDGFVVLVHELDGRTDGFIAARFGSAPPPFGEGSLFHVDDFVVADPGEWLTVGASLLDEIVRRAVDAGIESAIVVSGPPSIDQPKTTFLSCKGFAVGAEWWIKPIEPHESEPRPEKNGFDAAVGPAPPVYDPGGLTCLALRIDGPAALEEFEAFAVASDAVIAIVPMLHSRSDVRNELQARGYALASEWYTAPIP